jgi:hypothetical protein
MSFEAEPSSRDLRRISIARWIAVYAGALSATAILFTYSNLIVLLVVGALGVALLVVGVRLDRRVVSLGGRSAFAGKGGSSDA